MSELLELDRLPRGCSDDSFDDGLLIESGSAAAGCRLQ